MVHARVVGAVAVPVADDRLVARAAELEDLVLGVDLAVAVGVDDPLAGAVDADLVDAVAVEVADDRHVAGLAERERARRLR